MQLDSLLQLSDAQAVTSADAYSDYSLDLGNVTPKRRVGTGEALSIIVVVTTAAGADGGSFTDTFDFIVVTSANANLSSHDEVLKRRIPASRLVAGYVFELPVPIDTPLKRYLGARYELGTDDTISVDAFIVPRDHVAMWMSYAKGYNV